MKNPFKRCGFDSIISKGLEIDGDITLKLGTTLEIEGAVRGRFVHMGIDETASIEKETTLVVSTSGSVIVDSVKIKNLIISGIVICDSIEIFGTLMIKDGGTVTANRIVYQNLVIEKNAKITGNMIYGDFN